MRHHAACKARKHLTKQLIVRILCDRCCTIGIDTKALDKANRTTMVTLQKAVLKLGPNQQWDVVKATCVCEQVHKNIAVPQTKLETFG